MPLGNAIGALGRGLVAGAIGTAVMTLAQAVEMEARRRAPSTVPARAVEKTLGVRTRSEEAEMRLANVTHFAYGTAWGLVRGLVSTAGVRGAVADSLHLLLVWGAALAMLPRMGLAPPVREQRARELAIDLALHAVYAFATGAAFRWLERRAAGRAPGSVAAPA